MNVVNALYRSVETGTLARGDRSHGDDARAAPDSQLSEKEADSLLAALAAALNTSPIEITYLRNKLINDYQVQLISRIWDVFRDTS